MITKMKKNILLMMLLPASAWAADAPLPDMVRPLPKPDAELKINAAEPHPEALKPRAAASETAASETVISVDAGMLLNHPELLARAMYSAVVAQNIDGIRAVLPIYEQWPQHDAQMARYARALLMQADGRAGEAVGVYREFMAQTPDAPMVRWQLARALFEDKQNEAAADQFDRLQSEDLPDAMRQALETYRKALRERDSWQFNAALNLTREQNINQAPSKRRLGDQLPEDACLDARQNDASDDCFRGWTFDKPVDATAIQYQLGAEKKWSLPQGWYATAGGNTQGKLYPGHTEYNDVNLRLSVGVGHADQRNDAGIEPFHERRFYGNDPYTYNNGVRLYWNRWQTPKIQTLTALEFGRLKNSRSAHSDNQNRLGSASLVFYPNARQYWLLGADVYQERNKKYQWESFDRYGLRGMWGQEWQGGVSTRLQLAAAKRHYDGASHFSNGDNRQDKELSAALTLWHRALHFKGITPRLTVSHQKILSNDPYYEHGKSRMFIELGKTF